MMVSKWFRASVCFVALSVMLTIMGCGDSSGSSTSATGVVLGQGVDYPASDPRVKRQLSECLAKAQVQVKSHIATDWKFRIAGLVPADEAGFAVLPSGGVFELWLAVSPSQARRVAAAANREDDQHMGGARNLAKAQGSVVLALAMEPHPSSASEMHSVYRCAAKTAS
jgi:hypothetical protein